MTVAKSTGRSTEPANAGTAAGSTRRWRLVGVAVTTGVALLVDSVLARQPRSAEAVVMAAPLVFSMLALLAYGASLLSRSGRPAALVVQPDQGFRVPAHRGFAWYATAQVMAAGFLSSMSIAQLLRRPDGSGPVIAVDPALNASMTLVTGLMSVLAVGLVVAASTGRPTLDLTPHAVVVRGLVGARRLPWEAIRQVRTVSRPTRSVLALAADRPEADHPRWWRRLPWGINLTYLNVDPVFLADAVRYYVDRPQSRPAIGTAAKYQRLLAALDERG